VKENIGGYISNIRVKLIYKIFKSKSPPDYICYLDTDMSIRGSLDKLLDKFKHENKKSLISIRSRYRLNRLDDIVKRNAIGKITKFFNTGFMIMRNTDSICDLLKDWYTRIEENDNKWFSDQVYLCLCYHKHRNNLDYEQLPIEYNDGPCISPKPHFFDKSIVWHSKNSFENEKWTKEYNEYLKKYKIEVD
jgi:hypothetical protein